MKVNALHIKPQGRRSIPEHWLCPRCMIAVRSTYIEKILGYPHGFKYCPSCGSELNYGPFILNIQEEK